MVAQTDAVRDSAAGRRVVNRVLASRWAWTFVFILCLVPLALLLWSAFVDRNLTANPIEYITHYTGNWTLRFLLIMLAVTPLRFFSKRPLLTRFRRMLGLFAFLYGCLHVLIWAGLTLHFNLHLMLEDIVERRYITVGAIGFVLFLPLAITSTTGWVRRLHYRRWKALHRIVYLIPALGVIHYYWLVKSDVRLPVLYGALFIALMLMRIPVWLQKTPTA